MHDMKRNYTNPKRVVLNLTFNTRNKDSNDTNELAGLIIVIASSICSYSMLCFM